VENEKIGMEGWDKQHLNREECTLWHLSNHVQGIQFLVRLACGRSAEMTFVYASRSRYRTMYHLFYLPILIALVKLNRNKEGLLVYLFRKRFEPRQFDK
jgi:hypothetical protein